MHEVVSELAMRWSDLAYPWQVALLITAPVLVVRKLKLPEPPAGAALDMPFRAPAAD